MPFTIACRLGNYGKYIDRAWSHLPEIGVRCLEISVVTEDDEAREIEKKLDASGLTVTSLQGSIDLDADDLAASFSPQAACCERFGAEYLFVSVKAGDRPLDRVYQTLRDAGDLARNHGVTIVMETHPDLITNGETAVRTMQAVDHPNVRVNFDTANVHYYNESVDTVEELRKCIGYVAALHLKDSTGTPELFSFPTLGQGVVDFPAVFQQLEARGFAGPCTMELEGTAGVEMTESERLAHVADSVAYLKSIGAMA